MDPSKCIILVPYLHRIEPPVDEALRELERRGFKVWRVAGFSAIDQGRCKLAHDALFYAGAEEIMWVDSDVGFHPDDFERLRNLNLPIACAIYPAKGWPVMTSQFFSGDAVQFGEGGSLHKIAFAATGFLYTKREVYTTIVEKLALPKCAMWGDQDIYPWFLPMLVQGDNGRTYYLGEDYSFCLRARQAGYDIVADTTIRLQHWGNYPYQWEDVHLGATKRLPTVDVIPNRFANSDAPERVITKFSQQSHDEAGQSFSTFTSTSSRLPC